jgi:hypothetical protein
MQYRPAHRSELGPFQEIIGSIFLVIILAVWLGTYFFILVAVVAFGFFLYYRIPIVGAFRKSQSNADTLLARKILTLLFFLCCFAAFVALPYSANSALYGFLGGSFAFLSLYLSGLHLETTQKTLWTRFLTALVGGLKELALIFAFVAALYACATFHLRHTVVNSGTLRQLRLWDDRLLYARAFLSKLKFSAWQTIVVASAFIVLRAIEKRWVNRQAAIADTSWRAFTAGAKWLSRVALLALFAASFTLLATRSNGIGGEIGAHIRNFEEAYTQLQGATERAVESQVKRDLMAQAWQLTPQPEKDAISQAISNRKEMLRLSKQYFELRDSFNVKDAVIDNVVNRNLATNEPNLAADRAPAETTTTISVPEAAQDFTQETIHRLATEASDLSNQIEAQDPPEPAKSMADVIRSNLLDIVFDQAKDHFKFFDELNSTVPGLGEVLDSLLGAGGDAFLEQRKAAKAKALKEKLSSPDRPLRDIVSQEASVLAQQALRTPRSTPLSRQHLQQAKSRAADLRSAELALLQKAHSIELAALRISLAHSRIMENQVARLNAIKAEAGSPPSLHLAVRDEDIPKLVEATPPEGRIVIPDLTDAPDSSLAAQPPPPQTGSAASKTNQTLNTRNLRRRLDSLTAKPLNVERESDKFSDGSLFTDAALTQKLKDALHEEKELENQLVEMVGKQKNSQDSSLRAALGSDYERYSELRDEAEITRILQEQAAKNFSDHDGFDRGFPRRPGDFKPPEREIRRPEPYRPAEPHPRAIP